MIHISQFYPCSEVSLGCELYYICELAKYCKMKHGHSLSLDGVILKPVLHKAVAWQYLRIAVHNGWVSNVSGLTDNFEITDMHGLVVPTDSLRNRFMTTEHVDYDRVDADKRKMNPTYDMMTPQATQISFEKQEDKLWLWSAKGSGAGMSIVNNSALNNNRADQGWLSLVAMVAVERLFTNKPEQLVLNIGASYMINVFAVSYLMIMSEETLCFKGWLGIYFDEKTVTHQRMLQLGYYAWYAKGRDYGMCSRLYTINEKKKYMAKNLKLVEGDLVMLYTREALQLTNYVKEISGCRLAKIKKIGKVDIQFECINTTKPKYQGYLDFEDHTVAVKRMYATELPYEKLNVTSQSVDINMLGVGYMMHDELYFILPLDSVDDSKIVTVSDGTRVDEVTLSQNDLIYWILKDYTYSFNEERFLKRYFKNIEPMYTRYMRGEEIKGGV